MTQGRKKCTCDGIADPGRALSRGAKVSSWPVAALPTCARLG